MIERVESQLPMPSKTKRNPDGIGTDGLFTKPSKLVESIDKGIENAKNRSRGHMNFLEDTWLFGLHSRPLRSTSDFIGEDRMMHGTVKLFASFKERVGQSEVEWELDDGATVETLVKHLKKRFPGFGKATSHAWIAVNRRYVDSHMPLREGDEVAFLPPVSGG